MRRDQAGVFVLTLVGGMAALTACSVAASFRGLTGDGAPDGSTSAVDGGGIADAGSDQVDSGIAYASCAALHAARPAAADGDYAIDPDGPGPAAPFTGHCDMTLDDGGWLRIDDAHLTDDTKQGVTLTRTTSAAGALTVRVYANSVRCGMRGTEPAQLSLVSPELTWTHVRFTQAFFGHAACWTFAGGTDPMAPFAPGTLPFDTTVDVARDALRMGGTSGDEFRGKTSGCNQNNDNFWNVNDTLERHVTLILRRDQGKKAGLATTCDCEDVAPGTMSTTYWEYRDIYVR